MPWQSGLNETPRAICKMMMFVNFLECYRSRYITDDLSLSCTGPLTFYFYSRQPELFSLRTSEQTKNTEKNLQIFRKYALNIQFVPNKMTFLMTFLESAEQWNIGRRNLRKTLNNFSEQLGSRGHQPQIPVTLAEVLTPDDLTIRT